MTQRLALEAEMNQNLKVKVKNNSSVRSYFTKITCKIYGALYVCCLHAP